MTTNIKLFENWLAEEDTVETPPAAATTLTTTVKPGTPATAAPAMAKPITANNIIGGYGGRTVTANIVIRSASTVFDITKSTLTVAIMSNLDKNMFNNQVQFKYENGKFKLVPSPAFDQMKTFLSETDASSSKLAKQSLSGLLNQALSTITPPQTAAVIGPELAELISKSDTTSMRGSVTIGDRGELYDILGKIANVTLSSEVNIDTVQLTNRYSGRVTVGDKGLTFDRITTPPADYILGRIAYLQQLGSLAPQVKAVIDKGVALSQASAIKKLV